MKKHAALKYLVSASLAGLMAGISINANASSFQLFEYNGANAGNYGAGAAASAYDASTAFSNPAGMVMIPDQQIVIGANAVSTDIKFKGSTSWSTYPTPIIPAGYSYPYNQTGTAQGGSTHFIPSFHYVSPLSPNWAFGLSVVAPFGLVSSFGNNSLLNYSATDTELKTLDISPSLAFKVNDKFSVGAGLDAEHLDATLDGTVGAPYTAIAAGSSPNALNTQSLNEGDSWGYGWHAGLLYQLTQSTRIGLAYHSQIHFDLSGTSKFEGPLANQATIGTSGLYSNNNLKANVTLPPWTELSAHHDFNQQWSMDGSLIYTQWSHFNNVLHVQNVQGAAISDSGALEPQTVTINMPSYYRNTWRAAIGANYRPNDKWIFRAGTGYDESPTNNQYRSVRAPDADRYALAIGAHYQAAKTVGVDVGWTHLFIKDAKINQTAVSGAQYATATGTFYNHADIVGAQLTWDIS